MKYWINVRAKSPYLPSVTLYVEFPPQRFASYLRITAFTARLERLGKNVEQRAKTVPSAAKAGHNYNHLRTA